MNNAEPSVSLPQVLLFCDFGLPYTTQMKAAVMGRAPGVPVLDLMNDVPAFNIKAASVLLAQMAGNFPAGSVFVCVVDPGVGSAERLPGALYAGGRWFVGPHNGIFEHSIRRFAGQGEADFFTINIPDPGVSPTFHGRDLFAPAAGDIALTGRSSEWISPLAESETGSLRRADFHDDIGEIIYIDCFGNAMTGIRAGALRDGEGVFLGARQLPWARTFSDVAPGTMFAYENSQGLVEIAVNRGRADRETGVEIGRQVDVRQV